MQVTASDFTEYPLPAAEPATKWVPSSDSIHMKPLLLLAVAAASTLMSACVVEHDVYVRRPYYHHPYRREVVVETAPRGVVYYNDVRGRYYWRHHRRVYVSYY